MRLRDYLKELNDSQDVTFVIAEARQDENTPFMDTIYKTTPIRHVWEWNQATRMIEWYEKTVK